MRTKKCVLLMTCAIFIAMVMSACGNKEGFTDITWPDNGLAAELPTPESTKGKIVINNDESLWIEVANTSEGEYKDYIKKCQDLGFDVDLYQNEDSYYADNSDDLSLTIYHKDHNVMEIMANTIEDKSDAAEATESASETVTEETTESLTTETTIDSTETKDAGSKIGDSDIRPEFKEAMDSYEAFFDEYCDFMKKYNKSTDTTSMLTDYANYMTKYADTMEKMNAVDQSELSTAELKYYTEVTTRISQKLLEVAQ